MTHHPHPGDHTPPPAGDDGGERLTALGRETSRTARRVAELESLVRQLGVDVTRLAGVVGNRAPAPGEPGGAGDPAGEDQGPPAVRSWLLVDDPEQAATDLADLIGWLDRVYLAYPGAGLPSCWLWHPDVVEELWWLSRAHAEAYHPQEGSWLRVGDWHDRQRPGVVRRIREAAGSCELLLHTAERSGGHLAARPPPVAPLTSAANDIVAWVAAGRPQPAPEPTSTQLAGADEIAAAARRSWQ